MGQSNPKSLPHDLSLYEYLKCLICNSLSIQPVETSCCHNIYCESCLTTFKATNNHCPSCQSPGFEILPSFLGRRMINTIPSSCPLKLPKQITAYDLKDHWKECIKKFSEKKFSKKDEVLILDDAVLAKRIENTTSRTGKIDGLEIRWGEQSVMKGTFSIKDKVVRITTFDFAGTADWVGEVNLNNLRIKLVKKYRGLHKVYYTGKFNEEVTKLVGTWSRKENGREVQRRHFELNFVSQRNE